MDCKRLIAIAAATAKLERHESRFAAASQGSEQEQNSLGGVASRDAIECLALSCEPVRRRKLGE
jgi:hypothetical protein